MTQCFLSENYKLEEKGEHINQSVWYRETEVDRCMLNNLGQNKQNRNHRKNCVKSQDGRQFEWPARIASLNGHSLFKEVMKYN